MAHRITLIPGAGTGFEITEATVRVLEVTSVQFDWDVKEAGIGAGEKYGSVLPGMEFERGDRPSARSRSV